MKVTAVVICYATYMSEIEVPDGSDIEQYIADHLPEMDVKDLAFYSDLDDKESAVYSYFIDE